MRLNADGLASRVWSDWGAVCLAGSRTQLFGLPTAQLSSGLGR